jgi:hypothetical protein
MMSMMKQDFYLRFAGDLYGVDLSLNKTRALTCKDENIEEYFIENNDDDFEELFLIHRGKGIQNHMKQRSTNSEHTQIF